MARYAVVDKAGTVLNVITWDPDKAKLQLQQEGLVELADDEPVEIGGSFDGQAFAPAPPPPLPDLASVKAGCIAAIDAEFQRLQLSMFVAPSDREGMRALALAGAADVREAADHEAVIAATRQAAAALRAYLDN